MTTVETDCSTLYKLGLEWRQWSYGFSFSSSIDIESSNKHNNMMMILSVLLITLLL